MKDKRCRIVYDGKYFRPQYLLDANVWRALPSKETLFDAQCELLMHFLHTNPPKFKDIELVQANDW